MIHMNAQSRPFKRDRTKNAERRMLNSPCIHICMHAYACDATGLYYDIITIRMAKLTTIFHDRLMYRISCISNNNQYENISGLRITAMT